MVHRLDEILAQADPFDLAQALERYVGTLPASRIRELAASASERGGEYYRSELRALLRPHAGDRELRKDFVRFLKSNLRAIALFGPAFGEDVLRICPQHRVVAIGEDTRTDPKTRSMVLAGTAIALLVLGGAAEHAVSTAKAAAQLPDAIATPLPIAALPVIRSTRATAAGAPAAPAPAAPAHPAVSHPARPIAIAAPPAQYDVPPAQPAAPIARPERRAPRRTRDAHGPTVTVPVPVPAASPPAAPIDVNDMPNAYNDATPLPQPTAAPVDAPSRVSVPTPSPAPKHRSWLHRTLMHLDPFKP